MAGFGIITGGGPGIMEAANRGAREGGNTSVGCCIELPLEERPNAYLDISLAFRSLPARKTMFLRYAQAFVVFTVAFNILSRLSLSTTRYESSFEKGTGPVPTTAFELRPGRRTGQ